MQTVEKVIESSSDPVNVSNTVETVTTTTTTTTPTDANDSETIQITETHEIKTEINSQLETVSNEDGADSDKLSEPENNEMTGKCQSNCK